MECKLTLEVFRFNSKTDYLPYYKKHVIKIDENKKVSDLLALIKEDEKVFEYPVGKNAAIIINGLALFTNEKISAIKQSFGKELKLEPLNAKRATLDLTINDDDFQSKFDILDAFVDSGDRKVFKSYIREHYASPIINLDTAYLGDALFGFAYDMIEKYPLRKLEILNTIAKLDDGIWLHVNVSNKLFPKNTVLEKKIDFLKNELVKQDTPANKFVEVQQNISRNF